MEKNYPFDIWFWPERYLSKSAELFDCTNLPRFIPDLLDIWCCTMYEHFLCIYSTYIVHVLGILIGWKERFYPMQYRFANPSSVICFFLSFFFSRPSFYRKALLPKSAHGQAFELWKLFLQQRGRGQGDKRNWPNHLFVVKIKGKKAKLFYTFLDKHMYCKRGGPGFKLINWRRRQAILLSNSFSKGISISARCALGPEKQIIRK